MQRHGRALRLPCLGRHAERSATEERYSDHAPEEHDEDDAAGMEAYLQSLLQSAEKRVTRSSGTKLQWNPTMGDKNVILKD